MKHAKSEEQSYNTVRYHKTLQHHPALSRIPQEGSNPAIAISAVLACQLDHISDQSLFVSAPAWQSTLC